MLTSYHTLLYRVARSRLTHFKFEYCAGAIACRGWRKGNGRGEDAISYGQSQWSVGTCNNVLPVFVVSATSLGLLGRPTLLYQIFSCGGSWKTVCSGGLSWLFKGSNKSLLTKLRLLMRNYGGACTATSRHACSIDINGGHLSGVQKISL